MTNRKNIHQPWRLFYYYWIYRDFSKRTPAKEIEESLKASVARMNNLFSLVEFTNIAGLVVFNSLGTKKIIMLYYEKNYNKILVCESVNL